jgi:hypothetical protein
MQPQGCRLTSNQARAVELALRIGRGELAGPSLDDADWALLVLASGLHGTGATPGKACAKVLEDVARRAGYFEDRHGPLDAGKAGPDALERALRRPGDRAN